MTAPSIEYGVLSPMLIVFGVAVVGVLVEAFLPRRLRYLTQVALALAGLTAAFATLVTAYATMSAGAGRLAAVGAVTIDRPALFLQGTRDALCDLDLLRAALELYGGAHELHVVDGADHGFDVLARSGRTADEVRAELARVVLDWVERVLL